ncbi:MAG: hypothetical protein AAF199_01945, partial [Pseudomonadota bacterium]
EEKNRDRVEAASHEDPPELLPGIFDILRVLHDSVLDHKIGKSIAEVDNGNSSDAIENFEVSCELVSFRVGLVSLQLQRSVVNPQAVPCPGESQKSPEKRSFSLQHLSIGERPCGGVWRVCANLDGKPERSGLGDVVCGAIAGLTDHHAFIAGADHNFVAKGPCSLGVGDIHLLAGLFLLRQFVGGCLPP